MDTWILSYTLALSTRRRVPGSTKNHIVAGEEEESRERKLLILSQIPASA